MLSEIYPINKLKTILIPQTKWHPYPTANEREPWDTLPNSVRESHIERGERALKATYPELSATLFLEYYRTGDYMAFQKANFARRHRLRDLVTHPQPRQKHPTHRNLRTLTPRRRTHIEPNNPLRNHNHQRTHLSQNHLHRRNPDLWHHPDQIRTHPSHTIYRGNPT